MESAEAPHRNREIDCSTRVLMVSLLDSNGSPGTLFLKANMRRLRKGLIVLEFMMEIMGERVERGLPELGGP